SFLHAILGFRDGAGDRVGDPQQSGTMGFECLRERKLALVEQATSQAAVIRPVIVELHLANPPVCSHWLNVTEPRTSGCFSANKPARSARPSLPGSGIGSRTALRRPVAR